MRSARISSVTAAINRYPRFVTVSINSDLTGRVFRCLSEDFSVDIRLGPQLFPHLVQGDQPILDFRPRNAGRRVQAESLETFHVEGLISLAWPNHGSKIN